MHREGEDFVLHLISQGLFRGQILAAIRQEVLRVAGTDLGDRMLWTLLMPDIISVISVAGKCNLACRMCTGSPKGTLRHLSAAQLATIQKHIPTANLTILVASDAEPLLNPEFDDMLEVLAQHRQSFFLVTNGHLLKSSTIDTLVAYPVSSHINVSLDAATPETYKRVRGASLNHVIKNIEALRDRKQQAKSSRLIYSLLMVGMEDNIHELPAVVELAARLGAVRVKLDHMGGNYDPGDFMKNPEWPTYIRQAVEVGKRTGVVLGLPPDASKGAEIEHSARVVSHFPRYCEWNNRVSIGFDGMINPCCWLTKVNLGNIYEQPIYYNNTYVETRAFLQQGNVLPQCRPMVNCQYVQSLREKEKLKHLPVVQQAPAEPIEESPIDTQALQLLDAASGM